MFRKFKRNRLDSLATKYMNKILRQEVKIMDVPSFLIRDAHNTFSFFVCAYREARAVSIHGMQEVLDFAKRERYRALADRAGNAELILMLDKAIQRGEEDIAWMRTKKL